LPLTQDDLPKISGFGAFKIEKYGRDFLEVVQDYCHENNLGSQIGLKQTKRARKNSAPRERASDTKRTSYDMYREGNTIAEVAEARQLAVTTVETHLSYYISTGELDIDELVAPDKQELIEAAIAKYGRLGLKQLKDNLPEEISYGEIRMVAARSGR